MERGMDINRINLELSKLNMKLNLKGLHYWKYNGSLILYSQTREEKKYIKLYSKS